MTQQNNALITLYVSLDLDGQERWSAEEEELENTLKYGMSS